MGQEVGAMWGTGSWGEVIWGGGHVVPVDGALARIALAAALMLATYVLLRRPGLRRASFLALGILLAAPLIARSAYVLPHIFVNGTIADGEQVNENFSAITEDFARYVVREDGAIQDSVAISGEALDRLCGDSDGCNASTASAATR
jgi:hypothetical protein